MLYVKHHGGATIAELARHLGISDEGTRQHLIRLENMGWVQRREARATSGRSGRPASVYVIGASGELFFPKQYEDLSIALIDAVREVHGSGAIEVALARIADAKVSAWEPRLEGKSLDQKLDLLKEYYAPDDTFAVVTHDGRPAIAERNCPYLGVAMERPALCSTTVNALTRLLGYRVRRVLKFQNGDGCCTFEVLTDNPIDPASLNFELEEDARD